MHDARAYDECIIIKMHARVLIEIYFIIKPYNYVYIRAFVYIYIYLYSSVCIST